MKVTTKFLMIFSKGLDNWPVLLEVLNIIFFRNIYHIYGTYFGNITWVIWESWSLFFILNVSEMSRLIIVQYCTQKQETILKLKFVVFSGILWYVWRLQQTESPPNFSLDWKSRNSFSQPLQRIHWPINL